MGNRAARQRAGLEPYAVWVAVQTAVVATQARAHREPDAGGC